jgi:hypothetical protein
MIGRSAMLGMLALGLFGCAGTEAPGPSHLGGRAGQPYSWTSGGEGRVADADFAGLPYLGGRAGQPGSWAPAHAREEAPRALAGDAYLGGRMEQPHSWPVRQ